MQRLALGVFSLSIVASIGCAGGGAGENDAPGGPESSGAGNGGGEAGRLGSGGEGGSTAGGVGGARGGTGGLVGGSVGLPSSGASGGASGGTPSGGTAAGGASGGAAGGGSGATAGAGGSSDGADAGSCQEGVDACGVCGGDGMSCLCMHVEAVGYPGDGNTCNLGQNPGLVDLPHIAMDEYNYNQFFSDAGHNVPFDPAVGGYFSGTGDPRYGYPGEARGCGACLEVTGANGTLTFMVWEIADIGAVGANGTPTNVHLENTYIDQVRSGSGVASDVTIRPVPCPIGGDIQLKARIFNFDQPWLNAIYYTPYNYVYPIKKLEMRAATHTEWYELKRDWTNRFHYENYGGMMDMPHDDTNSSVQFRITSIYDDVVVSEPIQLSTGQEYRYFDLGVNFTPRPVSAGACSSPNHLCGNKQSDPGEICQPAADAPVTCDSLGLGSGIAPCDPFTCDWDTSRCGKDPGTCAYPSELGGNDCNAAFFPSLGTDSCTCL